jgi:hypothetical protein
MKHTPKPKPKPKAPEPDCDCRDGGHDSGDGIHCLCTGVLPRYRRLA